MSQAPYSTQELMIIATAREIANREVVFIGMRLPITAFGVATLTRAPDAIGLFEVGLARRQPALGTLQTMSDPLNQLGAAWASGLLQVMGTLPGGRVDAGFIGGAEIDRFGNVNSSYIGDWRQPKVKLPGSGGAADIAGMARRMVVIMNHEKHRFVERVSYVTSPGGLAGGESRSRAGLPWGGVGAVITDRAILRPFGPERELHLASHHPDHSIGDVRNHTGWDLKLMPDCAPTPEPTAAEIEALHQVDRDGFWR